MGISEASTVAPENQWLEDDFFWGFCLLSGAFTVSFWEGSSLVLQLISAWQISVSEGFLQLSQQPLVWVHSSDSRLLTNAKFVRPQDICLVQVDKSL